MTRNDVHEFRTAQLALIESDFSNLIEDDLGMITSFLDLCCQTHDALSPHHWSNRTCFRPCASSALNLASSMSETVRGSLPADLEERWLEWQHDYARLLARNPRLELADMMQDVSEMYDGSSWPYGREDKLKAWVDSDDITQFPFEMRRDFPTEAFYRRLQSLRMMTKGWLYWCEKEDRATFALDK